MSFQLSSIDNVLRITIWQDMDFRQGRTYQHRLWLCASNTPKNLGDTGLTGGRAILYGHEQTHPNPTRDCG